MLKKISLVVLLFLLVGLAVVSLNNRVRIEQIEKSSIVSQEEEFAKKFADLAKESKIQAQSLGATQELVVVKVTEVAANSDSAVGAVKKSFWKSNLGFSIMVFTGAIVIIFLVFKLKIVKRLIKLFTKTPVILLVGVIAFSLAGSVWADDKKPSVYQGIYDILSNQNKSIGKLSEWQGSWQNASELYSYANSYTDKKFAELSKQLSKFEKADKTEKAQKPAVVGQKVVYLVRLEKPKPDFSKFAQLKPNVNRLWGNPIPAVAEKVVEVKPQQPGNPQASVSICKETDAQKIQRLEQEKAQTEARLKDSEKQVKTLQEQNTKAVSNDEERKKECKPTRFLVGGRFYR